MKSILFVWLIPERINSVLYNTLRSDSRNSCPSVHSRVSCVYVHLLIFHDKPAQRDNWQAIQSRIIGANEDFTKRFPGGFSLFIKYNESSPLSKNTKLCFQASTLFETAFIRSWGFHKACVWGWITTFRNSWSVPFSQQFRNVLIQPNPHAV